MAGMSKAVLIGHLGRDPEVRYTPDGLAVTNFSVAATEKVKGQDFTQWFRVTAFGKLGEICGQYLTKGKQVYIEGRLQASEWEDRDGNKRFTLEVIANNMQMLGSRAESGAPPAGGGYQGQHHYQGGGHQPPAPQYGGGYQGGYPQGGGYGQPPGYRGQPPYQGGGYQAPAPQYGGGYQGMPPVSTDPGYGDYSGYEPEPYHEPQAPASPVKTAAPEPDMSPEDKPSATGSEPVKSQADKAPDDDDIPF